MQQIGLCCANYNVGFLLVHYALDWSGWRSMETAMDELSKSLTLADQKTQVTIDSNFETMELSIVVTGENFKERVVSEYYGAGYDVEVSPLERYLCVYQSSGFGESGYDLFELKPNLRQIEGLPCVTGVGAFPTFSNDELLVAVALISNPELYDEEDDMALWANLYLQQIPDGPISKCALYVISSLVSLPNGLAYEQLYPRIWFSSNKELQLMMPWGGVLAVPLPLPERLQIPSQNLPIESRP